MLKQKDKIFKNIYGFSGSGLKIAKTLGDWDNTKSIMLKGVPSNSAGGVLGSSGGESFLIRVSSAFRGPELLGVSK